MQQLLAAFQANIDALWATVIRVAGNPEDAQDCLQQTFIDASAMDPSTVRNWRAVLTRIATRRAIDVLRQKYRRKEAVLPEVESQEAEQTSSGLDFAELRESVRQCLGQLSANQAQAFWLRHVEQLSNQEIAAMLELSPDHVRVLIHRATTHLRKNLEPEYVESSQAETNG